MPYLRLPNGSYVEVDEGVSAQDALARAREKFPDAFRKPEKADTGFTGAFKAGVQELKGDTAALLGRAGLMDLARAEAYKKEQSKRAQEIFQPTQEGWLEAPLEKFKETLGGSLPYVAAPAVAAGAATLAAPSAPLIATGAALGAGALQYTGTNIGRQMETGKALRDTDLVAAGAAAIPQAALDTLSLRMIPGIGRIFGAAGKEITKETAEAIAKQGILKTAGAYSLQGLKTAGIEGTTEVAQQFLERLQAGLDISDPAAREEYFDSFIGGAVLGGTLSVPGTAYERSKAKAEGRRIAKEEQDEANVQRQIEEDARKASPEYRLELETKRNDLQAQISSLEAIAKDKNLEKEDRAEASRRAKELKAELRPVLAELKETPAETAKKTVDDILEERRVATEQAQEAEKVRQEAALKAREEEDITVKRHQALSNEVDSLQTDLQNAMKAGDAAKVDEIGAMLDKRRVELDVLSKAAQDAGISVLDVNAQLRAANKELNAAKKALATASEDETIALDAAKRAELTQAVRDAQAKVAEVQEKVELDKVRQAESKALAAKQAQRVGVLEEEEAGAPTFTDEERDLMARKDVDSRLAGTIASANYFSKLLDTAKGTFLDKEINAKKLTHEGLEALGLDEAQTPGKPFKKSKPRSFDVRSKDTDKLQQQVLDLLDQIDANEQLAKRYNLDIPADPRTPYLQGVLAKLQELPAATREKAPPSKVELLRKTRGEETVIPVLAKFKGKAEGISDYTPAQIARIRKDLENIKKQLAPQPKVKGIQPAKELDKKTRARLERRKTRLEQDLKDAQLGAKEVQAKPKVSQRIESSIETLKNLQAENDTPEIRQRIAKAEGALARAKAKEEAVFVPEGGRLVVPAKRAEGALADAMDGIDSLRKGEFFGGAASKEGSLETRTRAQAIDEIMNDVETYIRATISEINVNREGRGKKPLNAVQKQDLSSLIYEILIGKAIRATGWRAEQQRFGTETEAATKKAADNFQEQYRQALERSELSGNDLFSNKGEGTAQLNILKKAVSVLEDKYNDFTDKLNEANVKNDPDTIEYYKPKVQRFEKAYKAAVKEYEKAREEFTKGEMRGKGEIRTGMREEERVDIRKDMDLLKYTFGFRSPELNKKPEIEEETAVAMPQQEMPDSITELQNQAKNIMLQAQGIAKGIREAINMLLPSEARKAKATLDKFNKDKTSVIDIAAELQQGNIIKDFDEAVVLDKQAANFQRNYAQDSISYAGVESAEKITADMHDAAATLREDAYKRVNKLLDSMKATATNAVVTATKEAKDAYRDAYKQLAALNEEYRTLTKEIDKAVEEFHTSRMAKEGVERAKEALTVDTRSGEAIRRSQQVAARQTGLGLTGISATREIKQVVISNIAVTNMFKKVGPLRKAYEAKNAGPKGVNLNENERQAEQATLDKAYEDKLADFRAYAAKEGISTAEGEFGSLFIDLAQQKANSTEASKLKGRIEKYRAEAENIAMRFSESTTTKKVAAPETRAEQVEKVKELQSEQTEETKRSIERKRNALTAKQRAKMVDEIQKELDTLLSKPMPDKKTAPKAHDNYVIKRDSLKAQLEVATNADFETLRKRANIREAADLRYKPPSKIKLEKELKKLKKQQAEKDTPSLRARIAKVEGSLKYIEDAKTKETGIGAQGYIEERAIAAEQATKAREAALQQPLPTAEEKRKITLAKKTEERIGFKKQAINEKVLSDSFEKALKGYNYEVEGIRRAGLTPSEYKALTTKAEKQKLNVWENESADADVPFDDFREVWQGMRDDFDPRIEPAHGGKGLTKASVQSHIKSVSLPKGLKVIVVSKLTPTLRGAGMKHGLTDADLNGLRGGVTPDGTVFIVAEAHADIKDLNATLAHEITGHLGVEQTLGQAGMDALARQVAKQEGGVFKLADKLGVGEDALAAYMAAKRAGKDEAFAQAKALREVIAHTEEARVDKNFLQKAGEFIKALVGAVRAALRKMGVNLDINTNDVYKILRKARKEFKEYAPGAYTGRDGEFQYRATAPVFGGGAPGIVSLADKLMPKQKGLKERVFGGNTGLAFETRYVNRAAPIEAVFRNKGLENSIQATQVQYSLSMHDQRMAWTAQGVSNGIPKLRKGKGGGYILESLEGANLVKLTEALAKANWGDAAGVRDAYSLYRIAKRAANPKVGLAKLNFEGKITQAELDAVMRDVNSNPNLKSAFAEADKIYNQYNKDLMNLLVEVGALKPEIAADLVADNDYIPYYRVEKDEVFLDVGGAPRINIGNLQYQPYLHELVGGNERIVDIYTGALQNTSLLMDMALRNMATRNVAYALRDMGMLEVANKDEPNGGIRKGPGPASERTIRFRRDGVDHYAVVNTDAAGVPSSMLVHGLSGVNTSLPNMVKAMGAPARLLRSWVTRNPAYAARQVVRDPMVAVMSGGVDTVPILSSLKEVYKAMRGQSEGERTLQSYGLIGGQVFTGTSEDMAKIMLQLTSGKKGWESYLAKADTLAMQGDAATRTVAFDSYIKQGLTEMEAIVAVHKMMPFSQRGTSPSLFMLSTMIPFLNAQIQGLNVLYKSFRGKMPFNEKLDIKGKLYRRGMMMASLSMMYAMMMEDDEAYKNANDDERYKNWFVYVPGVDEPVRVPIPFELGFIFKAVPEALVNTMYGDKRASEAARALTKLVAESVPIGPSTIPQAVKSPIEIMANYSFYTGRPIISDRMKDLDPAERFNDNTLELSKLVGSVTGSIPILGNYLSPVQLEYLIRGYVGGLPLAVASMTNPIMRSAEAGNKPEMRASDMPVIGSFFQPVDAGGVINRAYRDMEDIIKSKQTYDKLESENRVREANAYLDAKADLIGLASLAGTFRQKMGELTKQERAIKSDPDLSGPEKRKMLDEIRQEKIELAKELSSERE